MRFRWRGPSLVIDTPAKLNLHLEVLGRRGDGFHELETVMVSVGLYDTLELTPAIAGIRLSCLYGGQRGPIHLPTADKENLVVRAASRLQDLCGVSPGVRIRLTKRIPMEAGMGGGSSDAAAALMGLNHLWRLGLDRAAMHRAAAHLGSDVNFFLDSPVVAVCRGRGERIEPREFRGALWFVVVKPPVGLSTAEVFRNYRLPEAKQRTASDILSALQSGSVGRCGEALFNALQSQAEEQSPPVVQALRELRSQRVAGAAMTGSGTACFAVCRDRRHAECVASVVRQRDVGAVYVVRTSA